MRFTGILVLGVVALVAGCASGADAPASSSSADVTSGKILLDCNVFESGGGPDQEVVVRQRGDELTLEELTNHGEWVERSLSKEEWASRQLKLRLEELDGPETVNRLYKEDGDWLNESKSDGWHAMGNADCFKDTTKSDSETR